MQIRISIREMGFYYSEIRSVQRRRRWTPEEKRTFLEEAEHPGDRFNGDNANVRSGGGVATIRQYLRAALIDELHLVIRPILPGSGEHLLNGIDMRALGYECAEYVMGERASHVILRRRG